MKEKRTEQTADEITAGGCHFRLPTAILAVAGFMAVWSIINGYSLSSFGDSYSSLQTNHTTFHGALDSRSEKNSRGNSESGNSNWISVRLERNFTSNFLARWKAYDGDTSGDHKTVEIDIPGLDHANPIELSAGDLHEFTFQTLDGSGNPRRSGGDYFETDLTGNSWKSRPPVKDFGNGSYSILIQVHPDFSGDYEFNIILLYRQFEGLKLQTREFLYDRNLRKLRIRFLNSTATKLPEIQLCREEDFNREIWSGRWTRLGKKDDCKISADGRYRCLDSSFPCRNPWCDGSLGSLESNGWVYSAHCSFTLFSGDSAWNCLNGRWIFFWGDSNHVDTIRNLLNFVLGLNHIPDVPRRFDRHFSNPKDPSQSVRITSIFNGHWNVNLNRIGLESLKNEGFRNLVKRYFLENRVPDAVILNSGLHDGAFWPDVEKFAAAAENAAAFWAEIMESVRKRGLKVPRVTFRSTVAVAGHARGLQFNPSKMEAYNGILLEKLKLAGVVTGHVIDDFDMTFPWHFDNRCSDGVHYGRPPAKRKWTDGQIGHQYFVDLMLVHVLLNSLCMR